MEDQVSESFIGINSLGYYLKRITCFIEGEKKILSFPKISAKLQEILLKVAEEGPKFLNCDKFSDDLRLEAVKVATSLKDCESKNVKIVAQIGIGKLGPNVLSYVKTQWQPRSYLQPEAQLSSSSRSDLPPLRESLTPGFKVRCFNTCSKFVKDDAQLVVRFPELTKEQAQFLINIIKPGKEGVSESTDVDSNSIYAPLWESMRLFALRYDYTIDYDYTTPNKDGLKCVVFEKIPKTTQPVPQVDPNVIDVDNLDISPAKDPTPPTTSANTQGALEPKLKMPSGDKLLKHVCEIIGKKELNCAFLHTTCQKVSDFMLDDCQQTIVFEDLNNKEMYFLGKIRQLSCAPATYMLFSSECQRYLDYIRYCHNVKKVRYTAAKMKDKSYVLRKSVKSTRSVDLDDETLSSSSEASVTSSGSSKKTKKKQSQVCGKIDRAIHVLLPTIQSRAMQDFIEDSLKRMLDFLKDPQQASIIFKQPSNNQLHFLQNMKFIVLHKFSHVHFNANCRKLLAELLQAGVSDKSISDVKLCKGGRDYTMVKLAFFPKGIDKITEPNTRTRDRSSDTFDAPQDIMELIILKSIIYDVFKHSGEQSVIDILSDISKFLSHKNKDRSITFDDLSDPEAKFVKNVHAASKMPDIYAMFSRDCQDLLRSIKTNALRHNLTVKMTLNDFRKMIWTVMLEKRAASPPKSPVRHRARSHSSGRRVAHMMANLRIEAHTRGESAQRPSRVKDKLKAGLAQPVHSDKALKMMESMGWKGGALGARGEGITEPIALPLDLVRRAGFGHVPSPNKPKEPKRKKQPKQAAPVKPKQTTQLGDLGKSIEQLCGLVPIDILAPGESQPLKSITIELKRQTYHINILQGILEIITKDIDIIKFVGNWPLRKVIGFAKQVVLMCNNRKKMKMDDELRTGLSSQIHEAMKDNIKLRAEMIDKHNIKVTKLKRYLENKKEKAIVPTYPEIEIGTEIVHPSTESQSTQASRPWYLPYEKMVKKTKEALQVPSLQSLALVRVIRCMNIDIPKDDANAQEENQVIDVSKGIDNDKTTLEMTTDAPADEEDEASILTNKILNTTQTTTNIVTDVIQKSTQATENPFTLFGAAKQKVTEETSNDVDQQTNNDTAMEIPKTLEKMLNKEPNENVEEASTSQKLTDTKVKTLVKNIKIPNMTRKQIALLKEKGVVPDVDSQKTTYRMRIEERKNDQFKHVEVNVEKYTAEMAEAEAKRRRMKKSTELGRDWASVKDKQNQEQESRSIVGTAGKQSTSLFGNAENILTSEVPKPPRMILIEKLPINNNDSTANKNPIPQRHAESSKSTVANRLAFASESKANDKSNDSSQINKNGSNAPNSTVSKLALAVNEVAPMMKPIDSIDPNDEVPNKNNETIENIHRVKCTDDNKTLVEDSSSTNENTETVTYVVPVECTKETATLTYISNERDKDIPKDNKNEIVIINDTSTRGKESLHIENDKTVSTTIRNSNKEAVLFESDNLLKADNKFAINNQNYESAFKAADSNSDNHDASDLHKQKEEEQVLTFKQERKRQSTDLDTVWPCHEPKKSKLLFDFKKVNILPKNYPQSRMNKDKAIEIQSAILNSLASKETLPILKCQGIQNGGLVYDCHDEKSLFFLEDLVKNLPELKLTYERDVREDRIHKLAFRLNSYMTEPVTGILKRLELYNPGLNATEWVVTTIEYHQDFCLVRVEMDGKSFDYVCCSSFVLCAGNDCARFTILWE